MSENYILRVRQPDGSWVWEMDNPMPRREAKKQAQFARVLGGIICQVWSEKEAREHIPPPPQQDSKE